ncbi:F-box only protein 33 isoform X1, partial [Tachysurus ichikawai]
VVVFVFSVVVFVFSVVVFVFSVVVFVFSVVVFVFSVVLCLCSVLCVLERPRGPSRGPSRGSSRGPSRLLNVMFYISFCGAALLNVSLDFTAGEKLCVIITHCCSQRNLQKLSVYGDTFVLQDDVLQDGSYLSQVDQGGKKIKE